MTNIPLKSGGPPGPSPDAQWRGRPAGRSHPRIAALFPPQARTELAGVLITEIEDNSCRAPLWSDDGSPSVTEARYCGKPTSGGSPWCQHHHRRFSAGPAAAALDHDLLRDFP